MQGQALQNKMRIILLMVQSINGKITRGNDTDIYRWTSKEDADFFFTFLKEHKLIVMGSNTYEAVKTKIKLTSDQLRIVLTGNPEKYKESYIEGQLEFRKISPVKLVDKMQKKGYETLLLVGGGQVNKAFFDANLVDELYITIEPRLFGTGKPLVSQGKLDLLLQLKSSRVLNKQGALLLHYFIKN